MIKNNSVKKIVLGIIMLISIVLLSTYALRFWNSETNTDVSVSIEGVDAYIVYNEGTPLLNGNLETGTDYKSGMHTTITLYKDEAAKDLDLYGHVYLNINEIGENLAKEEALKWTITSGDNTSSDVLAQGSFVDTTEGYSIPLKTNILMGTDEQLYTIWVWIDENEEPDAAIEGEKISTEVRAEATQITVDGFSFTSIEANANLITANVQDGSNQITGYGVTTTEVEPKTWESISNTQLYTLEYEAEETGTYYVWFKNSANEVLYQKVEVEKIDTIPPVITLESVSTTLVNDQTPVKISFSVTERGSGYNSNLITENNITVKVGTTTVTPRIKKLVYTGETNGVYSYELTLEGLTTDGTISLVMPAINDNLANRLSSQTLTTTVVVDQNMPTTNSVYINSDASVTKSTTVTLTLASTDATKMCFSNESTSPKECTNWIDYSTTSSWTLTEGDGEKTVYAFFKDSAGNITSAAKDSIILDTTAPEISFSANGSKDTIKVGSSVVTVKDKSSISSLKYIWTQTNGTSAASGTTFTSGDTLTKEGASGNWYLCINATDAAGNSTNKCSSAFKLDGQAPVISNVTATNVDDTIEVEVTATDVSTITYWYSIDGENYYSSEYNNYTFYNLGHGTYTVYVYAEDAYGNESSITTKTVTMSGNIPTNNSITINDDAKVTSTTSVELTLSSDGADEMCISNTTTCSNWIDYAETKTWTLTSGNGTKTVYAFFRKTGKSSSTAVSDSIILDIAPNTNSVTINGGDTITNEEEVVLTISSNTANEMCVSNTTSCEAWESYKTTRNWTLTEGDGEKTVYVTFRNFTEGMKSTTVNDKITLDTTPTAAPTITVTDYNTFTYTAEGASTYCVVTTNSSTGCSWVTTKTKDISAAGTYYVFAKDTAGNISDSSSISAYKLSLTKGTGIDLVTGSKDYVLHGAKVEITATATSGYTFSKWTVNSGNTPSDVNDASTDITITQATTLTATATDTQKPSTPTITRTDYNTFSYTATDNVGVTGYCVNTSNSTSGCSWVTATSKDISSTGTYYVWAKDAAGNISATAASIKAYTVTRNVGSGSSLTTRYDSTSSSSGTNFTSNLVVLHGTNVWAQATANSGYGSPVLTRGGSNVENPSYASVTGDVTIASSATDSQAPSAPTITRSTYNTFTYTTTDNVKVTGYYVAKDNSTAPTTSSTWITSTTYTISGAGTYYVWARDAVGNISSSSTIKAYTVTRNVGSGSSLTTRYDSTSSSSGTNFTSNLVVLHGTNVWAQATANSGYGSPVLKRGGSSVENPSYAEVTGDVTIASSATDTEKPSTPTITKSDYNTFTYTATDNVGVSTYCVNTSNSTSGCSWVTTKTKDISAAGTYYVFAKDAAGNISATAASIKAYTVTRNVGSGSSLTTRYDSTSTSTGTAFSSNLVVLHGTNVWAQATANSGYGSPVLKRGGSSVDNPSYATVTGDVTIASSATDTEKPSTPTITKSDYNTFTYTATDNVGVSTYCVNTSNSTSGCSWVTTKTKDISAAGTYYVFAKDAVGNISDSASIKAYTVTRNVGSGSSLTTRYDSTSASTGTEFTSNLVVLHGTNVWAEATANSGYGSPVLKRGGSSVENPSYAAVTGNVTIASSATDTEKPSTPTITRSTYNTFTYTATDNVGVTGYYVAKDNSTAPTKDSTWVTSTTYTINGAGTYYVWARDAVGNISATSASIKSYTITRNVGSGSSLTTRYDSTSSTTGTNFTSNLVVLHGTNVWAEATANSGYNNVTLKRGGSNVENPSYVAVTGDVTIASSATDSQEPETPTITRSTYNTFTYMSTDNVGVTGYYVAKDNSTAPTKSSTWITSTTFTINGSGTYYVWARDAVGNISSTASSIKAYTVTRNVGSGSSLTTRYDSTSSSTGTAFSSNLAVLHGTNVWAQATANSGYGSPALTRGGSVVENPSYAAVTGDVTIASSATDIEKPSTPTITKSDYNTFTYTTTDNVGVTGYCVVTTNSSTGCSWVTTKTKDISAAGTYYVFAKDAVGNISDSASIKAYTVTRNVGSGSSLTTRYDSTSTSTGTAFSSNLVVLHGTNVWAEATANSGYGSPVLKRGGSSVDNPSYAAVTGDVTIASSATDTEKPSTPTITRTDYNTFSYTATDNVGVTGYCVNTSNSISGCSWVTATSKDISSTGTYYVWAKDAAGNISATAASIKAYTVTRNVGSGSSLTTRYDSTSSSTGSNFTSSLVVLHGTNVWAQATANSGYGSPVLKRGGSNVENPSYAAVTSDVTIASSATDSQAPGTPTITRSTYNTFTYVATDNVGVTGYYVAKDSSTKPTTASTWITSTTYTISGAGTYYVWARDAVGNISATSASIKAYTVTRSVGSGSSLTTRYDSTSASTGTNFTSNLVVLHGTNVWAQATANSGYGSPVLTRGGSSVDNPSYAAVTGDVIIASSATDTENPSTPTITKSDYNTFTYTATDNVGVTGYCVVTTNSSTGCSWVTTKTKDISAAGTYYVFAKDAVGNISDSASIKAYTVTRSVGAGSSLTTRYDSTSTSTGTAFSSNLVVLHGTNVWAQATANSGYGSPVLKRGGSSVDNPSYATVTGDVTIASSATDTQKPSTPTITKSDYNTFTFSATDNVGVTGYCVKTTNSTSGCAWTDTSPYDISGAGTYYVWARDAAGNISATSGSIGAYTVTRSQGANTTLTTRYDSTSASTGTGFSSNLVVLHGTNVFASATASTGYSVTLKRGGSTVDNPSYAAVTGNITIATTATDIENPTVSISRQTYNTFKVTGTDNVGVTGYCVVTTNSSTGCSWSTTTTYSIDGAKTYYAFTKDAAGNVSSSANITAYTVTRNQGANTTLTTRYDSTSASTGTAFSSNLVVLHGTNVWAKATASSSYSANLTRGGSSVDNPSYAAVTGNVTIASTASDAQAPSTPTITPTGCNTFSYEATDNVGVTGYCVKTSNTTPATSDSCWSTTTSATASSTGTYYVWAKDASGYISATPASIAAYTVTRSQGANTTLTTRCNSTSETSGTAFTSNTIVLSGLSVWAKATPSTGYSATLTRGGSSVDNPSSATVTGNVTIASSASDPYVPDTPTITRKTYNTFSYSSSDSGSGLHANPYCVTTTNSSTGCSWSTTTTYTIGSAGTYYVFAKDAAGNISTSASIAAYTVTRSQGAGSTLVTRYDSTSNTTGTAFSSNLVVLSGTPVWAQATANTGYSSPVLKRGGSTATNPSYANVTGNVIIASSATDTTSPSVPSIDTIYDLYGSRPQSTNHLTADANVADRYTINGGDPYMYLRYADEIKGAYGGYFGLSTALPGNIGAQIFYFNSSVGIAEAYSASTNFPGSTKQLYIPFKSTAYEWASYRYDFGGNTGYDLDIANLGIAATANQWNRDDILLRLTTTEEGSGVSNWQYTYNANASSIGTDANTYWVTYASSAKNEYITDNPTFSTEMNKTVYVRACDSAGNCSTKASTGIKIDKTAPATPTITRSDYNTFTYTATDNVGVNTYCVNTSNSTSGCSWVTTTSKDVSSAGTYYVFAKDAAGNISSTAASIKAYTVTRSQGSNTTLTTRYDSTSASTGTAFTSNLVVLNGTNVFASATASTGYTATLTWGGSSKTVTGYSAAITGNVTIASSATDSQAPGTPTITRSDYNTFTYTATDNVGVTGYCVVTSNSTSGCSWVSTTSKDVSSAGTYYVFAKDAAGNISASSSISAYTVTRSQGSNSTLTTRYDSTSASTGTAFTSNLVVLNGTNVFASATASTGYAATLTWGGSSKTVTGYSAQITGNVTIASSAAVTTPSAPTWVAKYADDGTAYTQNQWTDRQVNTTLTTTYSGTGTLYMQYILVTDYNAGKGWSNLNFSAGALSKSGTTYTGTEPWGLRDRDQSYYFRACISETSSCSGISTVYRIMYDYTAPGKPTYEAFHPNDGNAAYTSGNVTNKQVHTRISAVDAQSGIKKIQYIAKSSFSSSNPDSGWSDFGFGISALTKNGTTWTGTENWNFVDRNNSYYFRACDNMDHCPTATSSFAEFTIWYDKTAPTATITQATGSTVSVAVTEANAASGYYYYWGTSSSPGDLTETTATSLTLNFTSSTTWYLYLKDKAGNTNTVDKVLTYDVTPPSISVSVPNGTTPAKSKTATITVSDDSGFQDDNFVIVYKWSTEEITECPGTAGDGWAYFGGSLSGTSGNNTATIDSYTGKGKIYVCPHITYPITDTLGNQATPSNTNPSSADMYLDNTPPVITVDGHTEDYTLSLTKDELSYDTVSLGDYFNSDRIDTLFACDSYVDDITYNYYVNPLSSQCEFNNRNFVYIVGSEYGDSADGYWRVVSYNEYSNTIKLIKDKPEEMLVVSNVWDGSSNPVGYENEVISYLDILNEEVQNYYFTGSQGGLFNYYKYLELPVSEIFIEELEVQYSREDIYYYNSYFNLLTYNDLNSMISTFDTSYFNGYLNTYIGQGVYDYDNESYDYGSGYIWHYDDLLEDYPLAPSYDFQSELEGGDVRPVILLRYDTPVQEEYYWTGDGTYDNPYVIDSTVPSAYTFPTGTVTDKISTATISKKESVYPEWIDEDNPGTVTYTATDAAGNTSTLNVTVYLRDESAPTATLTQSSGSTVTASITEDIAVAGYYWSTTKPSSTSEITWTSTTSTSLTLNITSSSTYYFYVKDSSGNVSVPYSITPTYDVTPPSISVSVTNGTTAATNHTATITLSDSSGFSLTSLPIFYKWSTETITECPSPSNSDSGWSHIAIPLSGTSGNNTITITNEIGIGNGKIYVCPTVTVPLLDKWGNQATYSNTTPVSASLYLKDDCNTITLNEYNDGNCYTGNQNVDMSVTIEGGTWGYYADTCTFTDDNSGNVLNISYQLQDESEYDTGMSGVVLFTSNLSFVMPSQSISINCYSSNN